MDRCRYFLGKTRAFAALVVICALLTPGFGKQALGQAPLAAHPNNAAPGTPSCVIAPRPNSLWSLAQCCSKNLHGDVDCRNYDAADDYIILKDNSPRKPAAYLIIPTIRVTGIEDKQIFQPPVINFWKYAWQQARFFVKKPAAEIGLALNSARGRTQNQLHIHIACMLPAVVRTLADNAAKIGSDPATSAELVLAPADHPYRVVKVSAALADADSPFNLVAEMPGAASNMGAQSIAVVGTAIPGTYYLLDTVARGANPGFAEELLDQTCRG